MIEKCKNICCKVWDKIKAVEQMELDRVKIQQVIYGSKNF